MKKKIALTLVIVLVIGTMVGVLTGCDEIFKKNNDRDLNQIVAHVSYKDLTADVKKFEMMDTFNAYAYMYVQYYGMSYSEAANFVAKSLAERELLTLFAMDEIANAKDPKQNAKAMVYFDKDREEQSFLNETEYYEAINRTNKDLLNALEESVKQAILEDKANAGDGDKEKKDPVYTGEITNPVYLNFNSKGGSAVPTKTVEANKLTYAPQDPTKAGFTFFGWEDSTGKLVDFEKDTFKPVEKDGKIETRTITLYARWKAFDTPRTERPVVEKEEKEFDPEGPAKIVNKFFDDDYINAIDFSDKDFVKDIILAEDKDGNPTETVEEKLKEYIDRSVTTIKKNLKNQHKDYDYFLNSQLKIMVIDRFERMVKDGIVASDEEIQARFDEMVALNQATFGKDGIKYTEAFKSSFATSPLSVYKTVVNGTDKSNHGYGFVHNILIKLPQEDVDAIYQECQDYGVDRANKMLDEKIAAMEVKIANPDYKKDAPTFAADESGKPIEKGNSLVLRDPMMDELNPYNGVGENKSTYYNKDNNYNNILSFEYVEATDQRVVDKKLDEGFQIVYNVHEAPAMAYLINKHPAFIDDADDKTNGVVEQIYKSFETVSKWDNANHPLTDAQKLYWLKEVSTAWLYLIGDDGGSLNKDSNNGGLGYLVNPEGEESGFLEGFTKHARALIDKDVTGFAGDKALKTVNGGEYSVDGTFGRDKSYVVDNNFIVDGDKVMPDKASAYAGVFVLLTTQTSYVPAVSEDINTEEGFYQAEVPDNFIVQINKDADKCFTIKGLLKDTMDEAKKDHKYSEKTNQLDKLKKDDINITYYEKVYESLYKDLEKKK